MCSQIPETLETSTQVRLTGLALRALPLLWRRPPSSYILTQPGVYVFFVWLAHSLPLLTITSPIIDTLSHDPPKAVSPYYIIYRVRASTHNRKQWDTVHKRHGCENPCDMIVLQHKLFNRYLGSTHHCTGNMNPSQDLTTASNGKLTLGFHNTGKSLD